jgi:peptidoglycan/xylan/chitin deacetylase (PgdA/CDA1 family)
LIALPDDIINTDAATITAISTSSPVVAMTFDDGRHPTNTPHLLDMLRERDIRATLNMIGNHSYTHPFLDRLGASSGTSEIDRTSDATFQVTGRPPLTFRPPYGAFTRNQRTGLHAARPCRQFYCLWIHKTGAARVRASSPTASCNTPIKAASFCPTTSTKARSTP